MFKVYFYLLSLQIYAQSSTSRLPTTTRTNGRTTGAEATLSSNPPDSLVDLSAEDGFVIKDGQVTYNPLPEGKVSGSKPLNSASKSIVLFIILLL